MTGLCNANFGPNTAHRNMQWNWKGKKHQLVLHFVSTCLTKFNRQSTDMSDLLSFPYSGDTAAQRLKKDLILRRLMEKMCCDGGFHKLSILYPHYCTTHGASLHKELQLAAALNFSWSSILQPMPSCLPNSKNGVIPRSLAPLLKRPYKMICYTTEKKNQNKKPPKLTKALKADQHITCKNRKSYSEVPQITTATSYQI